MSVTLQKHNSNRIAVDFPKRIAYGSLCEVRWKRSFRHSEVDSWAAATALPDDADIVELRQERKC